MSITLLVALLVRLVWVLWIDTQPLSDFRWYFDHGLRIAAGKGYSVEHDGFPLWAPGNPLSVPRATAFWPVGYPGFLGALFSVNRGIFEPLLVSKLANVGLQIGTVWLVGKIAESLFRSALAARLGLLLVAFAPNHIAYTTLTATESYFTFLVCAGVALLLYRPDSRRPGLLFAAGLVFGLAVLTKPQVGFLPLVVLALLRLRDWKHAAFDALPVYAGVFCIAMPWAVRNYQAFGAPVAVSTNGWVNLLIGNLPGSWGQHGVMWNRELQEVISQSRDELSWNEGAKRVVLSYMAEHPGRVIASVPGKVFALFATDVDGFGWNRAATPGHQNAWFWLPLRVTSQIYYMVCLAGFALFLRGLRDKSRRTPRAFLAPAVVVYFTLIYCWFFGGARFHYPLIPWMYACAGAWMAAWLECRLPAASAA